MFGHGRVSCKYCSRIHTRSECWRTRKPKYGKTDGEQKRMQNKKRLPTLGWWYNLKFALGECNEVWRFNKSYELNSLLLSLFLLSFHVGLYHWKFLHHDYIVCYCRSEYGFSKLVQIRCGSSMSKNNCCLVLANARPPTHGMIDESWMWNSSEQTIFTSVSYFIIYASNSNGILERISYFARKYSFIYTLHICMSFRCSFQKS